MNWLILTLVSAVTASITRILQKKLLDQDKVNPAAFAIIFQLTVAALFLGYALLTKSLEFPSWNGIYLNIVFLSLLYSLGNIFTFHAFRLSQASEVLIIFASSIAWTVVSAVLFLGESLSLIKILGISLVITGIVVINFKKTKWHLSRGHLFALIGAIFFGLAFTNDAFILTRYTDVASYMIPAFALPALMVTTLQPKSVNQIPRLLTPRFILPLLVCATVYAISALTIFSAFKIGGPVSVIAPLQQISVVISVILSYFWLKETDRLKIKITGTILVLTGAILLV